MIAVDDFQQQWEKSFQHLNTSLAGQAACSRSLWVEKRLDRFCATRALGKVDKISALL